MNVRNHEVCFGSKLRPQSAGAACPFYPQERTFLRPAALRQKLPLAGSKSNFRLIPESRLSLQFAARPKSANNGSDHFGVLGLRVAAASCHSGKQEQTSKRSVRQHVAILPVTGAIGPV